MNTRTEYLRTYRESKRKNGWKQINFLVPDKIAEQLKQHHKRLMAQFRLDAITKEIVQPVTEEEYLAKLARERESIQKPVAKIPEFDGTIFR